MSNITKMLLLSVSMIMPLGLHAQQQPTAPPDPVLSKLTDAEQTKIDDLKKSLENYQLRGMVLKNEFDKQMANLNSNYTTDSAELTKNANAYLKAHGLEKADEWNQSTLQFVVIPANKPNPTPKPIPNRPSPKPAGAPSK
jgi:hypothetical protein